MRSNGHPLAKTILLVVIALAWIALDQWTKSLFVGGLVGDWYGSIFGGLLDLRLVHNTGAAWGIFEGNPAALGAFSLAVCGLLLVYFIVNVRSINAIQTVGIALIEAGGIGNAIDRFAQGYVIDFLSTTFIDFPVFNVADIGVTCGVAILLLGLIVALVADPEED